MATQAQQIAALTAQVEALTALMLKQAEGVQPFEDEDSEAPAKPSRNRKAPQKSAARKAKGERQARPFVVSVKRSVYWKAESVTGPQKEKCRELGIPLKGLNKFTACIAIGKAEGTPVYKTRDLTTTW